MRAEFEPQCATRATSRERRVEASSAMTRASAMHASLARARAEATRAREARARSASAGLKKCIHSRRIRGAVVVVAARDGKERVRDAFAGVFERARCVCGDSKSRVALESRAGAEDAVGERPFSDAVFGFVFSMLAFGALGMVDESIKSVYGARAAPFMCGSWASLSVLAFGVVDAPPMRMWNVLVGTVCSAAIATALVGAFGASWQTRALSLSLSTACMMRLGAIHPPAGALAMIIVDNAAFTNLGWTALAYPALAGSLFIVAMSAACQTAKTRFEFEWSDVVDAIGGRWRRR